MAQPEITFGMVCVVLRFLKMNTRAVKSLSLYARFHFRGVIWTEREIGKPPIA